MDICVLYLVNKIIEINPLSPTESVCVRARATMSDLYIYGKKIYTNYLLTVYL